MDALTAAEHFVSRYFRGCDCAILAGSILLDDATSTSDLDIVVIADNHPDAPFRESFRAFGWPVEVFVHTRSSLEQYFQSDVARRRPSLQTMIAEGVVVQDASGIASHLQTAARSQLDAGPPPLSQDELDAMRYMLTDLIEDLVGCVDADEMLFIAFALVESCIDFILAVNCRWTGSGKWRLRALRRFDPQLAYELTVVIQRVFQNGDTLELVSFVDKLIKPYGGRCFEGYRQGGNR